MKNKKFKAKQNRNSVQRPNPERGIKNMSMIVSAVYATAAQVAAEEAAKGNGCAVANA